MRKTRITNYLSGKQKFVVRKILALILCMVLVPISSFCVSAESSDAALSSLYFKDLAMIDFDPNTTSYEAVIPYRYEKNNSLNFYVPEVVAQANDPEANVEITYPEDPECGAINVKVTAANGTTTRLYSISLETAGKNLYTNGGFEQALSGHWNRVYDSIMLERLTDDVFAGDYSMKVTISGGAAYIRDAKPTLSANKLYIESNVVKSTAASGSIGRYQPSTATIGYFNEDGTADSKTIQLTNSWQRKYMTVLPTADTEFYSTYTSWAKTDPFYVDEYYVGELVVADVAVTDESGARNVSLISSGTESKQIQLSAAIFNQFGNKIGLGNEKVDSWSVVGNPAGVTVDENGLVTVAADAPLGNYTVEAVVTPGYAGAVQEKVKGAYVLSVTSEPLPQLSDIKISDPMTIDFDSETTEYSVVVPYKYEKNNNDNFEMPEVTATAADPTSKVNITYPEKVENGEIIITVEDAEGRLSNRYTINLITAGKNLYTNGGFEQALSGHWGRLYDAVMLERLTEDVFAGDYSMKVTISGGAAYIRDAKPTLSANKLYIESNVVKSTAASGSIGRYQSSTATIEYFKEDGTADSKTIDLTNSWQRKYMTVLPTADTEFYSTYTSWAKTDPFYVDEYYVGELVVADVAVTDESGARNVALTSSGTESKQIQLSAAIFNQFGNKIGLGNEKVDSWSVVGNPAGVTVDENGLVTVAADAPLGNYTVEAVVTPGYAGAVQEKVKGAFKLIVFENKISYMQNGETINSVKPGNVTCTFSYTNVSASPVSGHFYNAIYTDDNGVLKLHSVIKKPITIKSYETVTDSNTITIPAGSGYVVKSFLWNENIIPLMEIEPLK